MTSTTSEDYVLKLLMDSYEGKTPNDEFVRLRAPIDIFAAIRAITWLQKIIAEQDQKLERCP